MVSVVVYLQEFPNLFAENTRLHKLQNCMKFKNGENKHKDFAWGAGPAQRCLAP
jgi:hypothetical protein